jgi:tetratricopeptide (TPR) repeat protein
MKAVIRVVTLTSVTLTAAFAVTGQDLGSANKLFGGAKPAPTATKTNSQKKTAVAHSRKPARAVASRNRPAVKTATKRTTASKTDGRTSAGSESKQASTKSREITTPTGTKVTNTVKPPSPPDTSTRNRFSGKDPSTKPDSTASTKVVDTKISPADAARFEQLIEQGNSARDDRDYSKAESAYKSARSIKPRDGRAVYGLGNLYNDQQRWEEAENAYRTAIQLEPSSAVTYVALSYVLTQPLAVANLSERYAEAEKLARRATELSPRSALAFDQLGVAMEMRGEIGSETEAMYHKSLALDPAFAPAYAHLGRFLRRRGMTDRSKEAYAQAVERSTDVGTTVLIAEVLQSEQHYSESMPLLKQALDADPRNPSALLMMGHALTVTGQYKDAEATLQRAASVGPSGYQANVLLASLYMRQGAYELAENSLLQALRWAPAYENRQLAQQFVMLGQGYSKTGKAPQSQRAYSQASKLDPDSGSLSGRFHQ